MGSFILGQVSAYPDPKSVARDSRLQECRLPVQWRAYPDPKLVARDSRLAECRLPVYVIYICIVLAQSFLPKITFLNKDATQIQILEQDGPLKVKLGPALWAHWALIRQYLHPTTLLASYDKACIRSL